MAKTNTRLIFNEPKLRLIEYLIVAIDESTFKTVGSARHHHYISGTLEHCLGVYRKMSRKAAWMRKVGVKVNESDVILESGYWHPPRLFHLL